MRPPVVRVMVDSPLPQLDRLFDYAVPEALRATCVPGVRVRVPLRSAGRVADGYVVEMGDGQGYDGALSEVEQVVSPLPVLRQEIWALAREVARRRRVLTGRTDGRTQHGSHGRRPAHRPAHR
ncbi:primosomal protein N' family DNA-binding protein, partial [Clavibacter michiganensis]